MCIRDSSVFAVGAFIALFIAVLHAPAYAAIFLLFLYIFAVALPLVLEYLQKRSFYTPLLKNLEELDKKYLMSELIDEPSFTEGKILYEVLVQSNKSMNDEIARYRLTSQEYREYIEAWVHEVKTPIASSRLIIENNQSAPTPVSYTHLFLFAALDAFLALYTFACVDGDISLFIPVNCIKNTAVHTGRAVRRTHTVFQSPYRGMRLWIQEAVQLVRVKSFQKGILFCFLRVSVQRGAHHFMI